MSAGRALHVAGDTATTGLRLPMTSDWHYAIASIEFLRIPLFSALSGYLYAGKRLSRQTLGLFWHKRPRRLGVPLVCATTVVWYPRGRTYADSTSFTDALLFPLGHLC